jgi:hypothetical protein
MKFLIPCNGIGFPSEELKVSSGQVQLNLSIRTLIYNTTGAERRCSLDFSLDQHVCTYSLPFLGQSVAVLSSSLKEVTTQLLACIYSTTVSVFTQIKALSVLIKISFIRDLMILVNNAWDCRTSLGGLPTNNTSLCSDAFSAILAIVLLLLYEIVSLLCDPCAGRGRGSVEQRTPLLTNNKEEDGASLGSSYDSVSNDGDDDAGEESGEGGVARSAATHGRTASSSRAGIPPPATLAVRGTQYGYLVKYFFDTIFG